MNLNFHPPVARPNAKKPPDNASGGFEEFFSYAGWLS
jgi:hypothetical protein